MDRKFLYAKLTRALVDSNYRFDAKQLTEADISKDHDMLSSSIRMGAKILPFMLNQLEGFHVPSSSIGLPSAFTQDGLQQRLDEIAEFSNMTCFKYILNQPVAISVIDSDHLSQEDMMAVSRQFDSVILDMLGFTGRMGGFFKIKLSVTGIILFVFFDRVKADTFVQYTQDRCKFQHFWKKTWVLPWCIDVTGKQVKQHNGLPIIVPQILDSGKIAEAIFSD
jgi:hypothetical protein